MKILRLVILLITFTSSLLFAETRHPRVVEIEQKLSKEATDILKAMFPGKPTTVWVLVDPIRRSMSSENGKESLPFYEVNEEIRDEWDNPEKTDYELLARVNKIYFKISLPSDLSQEQVQDAKTSVFQTMRLVEGRDMVEINQKNWMVNKPAEDYTPWVMGIGVALLSIFGIIYFVVNSVAINRITKAIRNIKIQTSDSGGSVGGPITGSQANDSVTKSNSGAGDLRLNDPVKMGEVLRTLIQTIEKSPSFPDLFDMMTLEKAIQEDPSSVGAMLLEFPETLRNRIFAFSFSSRWLEALTHPGELKVSSIELLNRLSKNVKSDDSKEWQELLICCWRLDKNLAQFLKTIPYEHALSILAGLPRSISLPVAREIVPGNWGILLKPDFKAKSLEPAKIDTYKQKALSQLHLRSLKLISEYKREVDLIEYLHTADPQVEKEVYGASDENSYLHKARPAFYKVLEATEHEIRKINLQISIEDWALSVINIPKTQRSVLETCFSERQKFRFIELLKFFDKNPPGNEKIGDSRSKIARVYHQYIISERAQETSQQSVGEEVKAA